LFPLFPAIGVAVASFRVGPDASCRRMTELDCPRADATERWRVSMFRSEVINV
jgi:hypothetical protein